MAYEFADPFDVLLRLSDRLGGDRRRGVLTVQLGELTVGARFLRPTIGAAECGLELEVRGRALPMEMVLASHHSASAGATALAPTGDPQVDALVGVAGDLDEAAACLDAEARWELTQLLSSATELVLRAGTITFRDPHAKPDELAPVEEALRSTVRFARRLAAADDVDLPEALRTRAFEDPVIGVRRRALTLLLAREGATAASDAVDRAMNGDDLVARIVAAPYAGERGRAQLTNLARNAPSEDLRVRAIEALRALAVESPRPSDELLFLQLLDPAHSAVTRAAARALAKVGTLRAVEGLLALTGTSRFGAREVEQAALGAVREIQSRYHGEAGLLSLEVSSGAGELSLANTEEGALSVADGGEVSLQG